MKNIFDCIIPFYNEGKRPLYVVDAALRIKNVSKIIVVDDGSIDKSTFLELKKIYPQIVSIRIEKNCGKANAIREGFKYTSAEYILLLDGDLTNILTDEIENAQLKLEKNPKIDMIILRRVSDATVAVSHWIRHDIIFSGQRILRRTDLEKIFENNVSGYNLESAINSYMIRNHKIVYWMPFSIHNLHKHHKWGIIEGLFKIGIPGFINFMTSRDILWQTLFFCRDEAP